MDKETEQRIKEVQQGISDLQSRIDNFRNNLLRQEGLMSPKSCYIKPIPDDGPKKKEIPFPRYNTKFVENREYDFYEKGWYGIDGYLYNVPPKVAKVTEAGYFCPDCGAKADKEHMHVCYQCFVWGISY